MELNELKQKLDQANYIYDEILATTLFVALKLGRPLLIEGAAGVGKTEVAKVMASALDRELVRMQCYEGLDESKALYEWNYQKQLLSIQVNMASEDKDALTKSRSRAEAMTLATSVLPTPAAPSMSRGRPSFRATYSVVARISS